MGNRGEHDLRLRWTASAAAASAVTGATGSDNGRHIIVGDGAHLVLARRERDGAGRAAVAADGGGVSRLIGFRDGIGAGAEGVDHTAGHGRGIHKQREVGDYFGAAVVIHHHLVHADGGGVGRYRIVIVGDGAYLVLACRNRDGAGRAAVAADGGGVSRLVRLRDGIGAGTEGVDDAAGHSRGIHKQREVGDYFGAAVVVHHHLVHADGGR